MPPCDGFGETREAKDRSVPALKRNGDMEPRTEGKRSRGARDGLRVALARGHKGRCVERRDVSLTRPEVWASRWSFMQGLSL
jgi:hypothetical protein